MPLFVIDIVLCQAAKQSYPLLDKQLQPMFFPAKSKDFFFTVQKENKLTVRDSVSSSAFYVACHV